MRFAGCAASRRAHFVALVATSLSLAAPLSAQARPTTTKAAGAARSAAPVDSFKLTAPLPVDPAVRVGQLPNGLRYYVRRNAKPEKRAELRLVINAGSILEDNDQRGLAHFVEHMAFNGTQHFKKNDIVKYLESIGVRFGADLNAETSFDETTYILPVPTDSAGILERSFQFLGDVAAGVLFDSAEVVAERGVVLAEWRDGLGAGERIRDQQFPIIFRGSRYADRLPIGKPEIIEKANPGPVKRFWRDWYRPDLMAVIAVGDAEPAKLEALIRSTFSPLARRANARPRINAVVPRHDSTLISVASDPELTSSSVGVLWKLAPTTTRTVGDLRKEVMRRLYNTMLNSRFSELSQRPDAPFVAAGVSSGSFVRGSDYASLDARAKEGKVLESFQAILTEAERVQQHGFLASELERGRTNFLRSMERAYTERDKTPSASFVGDYIDNFLSGEAIPGIAFEYAASQKLLPTITLQEMNALGAERRGAANRVVTVTLPKKDGLTPPSDADIRAVFAKVAGTKIAPWTETVADGALVKSLPAAGKVVSIKAHDEVGTTEWTLSNGIRVFVKPTDFNADQVLMTAWSAGGVSLLPDSAVFKAQLTTTALERSGVGEFSLIDLNKKLTGKVAQVQAFIGDASEGLNGRASPKDLETMMQLTWLRLMAPRTDSVAMQALLQQFEAVLRNRPSDPGQVFSDTVQMTLAGGNPRVRPLSVAMLKELDLNQMLAIYKDRFADPGDLTFVFVGNIDLATFKPLVEQYIASLPTTNRHESARDVGPKLFSGHIDKAVRKGLAPQSQSALMLAGAAPWSRDQAYLLSSLGEVLEMRLLDRLREALGGTYSVSVNTALTRRPRQEWQVVISYGSAPEKADTMYKAVLQELDSLRRVPPTAAEVERVREQQRRELEVQRKQNGFWIGALQGRLEFGDDLATINESDARIAALTPEKLAAVAKRYLDETNRARFVLLPEPKTP